MVNNNISDATNLKALKVIKMRFQIQIIARL